MRLITDLHIHSKYSRACSRDLTLENIALWCEKKGIDIVATADFTHPKWFSEIETKLVEAKPGLYRLKDGSSKTLFIMSTELSQIYKKGDKTRRIHNVVLAPSIKVVRKINEELERREFNLASDGRPILGIDSEELYKILKNIDERILLIPAHAWTPWYSVFGSKSGFDSIEECFGSMASHIHAIETGLSSDPAMNGLVSGLDNIMLVSNSDAHSLRKLGREANVFEMAHPSFDELARILRERDVKSFLYTIEFYPEEGKYHADGCADCAFSCEPEESKRLGGRCPKCGKLLVIGVLNRVAELSDRKEYKRNIPHKYIVPLEEIIAECFEVSSANSKRVQEEYERLVAKIGSEFYILLDAKPDEINAAASESVIADAIMRVREGDLHIAPGYDGIFGKVRIFSKQDRLKKVKQTNLI
ncbi:MAG: hypothetical protein ACD_76C00147G0005 [uncultured bacterium]|nr:MAG: hypothetical protein ACD_76C00147G0005 [uncultured bacterium]HBD05436.1 DNA helicase UvrD [Candidatus Uhrbacteria bacterium]